MLLFFNKENRQPDKHQINKRTTRIDRLCIMSLLLSLISVKLLFHLLLCDYWMPFLLPYTCIVLTIFLPQFSFFFFHLASFIAFSLSCCCCCCDVIVISNNIFLALFDLAEKWPYRAMHCIQSIRLIKIPF